MYIDLNAPDNSTSEMERQYMKLWQHVLINFARQACESRQEAYNYYNWSKGIDCRMVCEFANIDVDAVRVFFKEMHEDTSDKAEILKSLKFFKSATKGLARRSSQYVQPELFI